MAARVKLRRRAATSKTRRVCSDGKDSAVRMSWDYGSPAVMLLERPALVPLQCVMDFLAQVIAELIRVATFQPRPMQSSERREDDLPARAAQPEEQDDDSC